MICTRPLGRRIDDVALKRWALFKWNSFHAVAFPSSGPQSSGALVSRLLGPKAPSINQADKHTKTHRPCLLLSWQLTVQLLIF